MTSRGKFAFTVHRYDNLVQENGLRDVPAAHALMEYALMAGGLIEDYNHTVTGQKKVWPNWKNIMLGISKIHGIPPEEMIQQWDTVDAVLAQMKLKPLTGGDVRMSGKLLTAKGKRFLRQ